MKEQSPLNKLLAVLHERDIPLTRDDVKWAFESPKTNGEVTAWVEHYLTADTLLSKEEAELLFSKLEKNGTVRDIAANHDLSIVKPVSDDEIKTAIEALESSTAAINKQNAVLQAQRESLAIIVEQNYKTTSRRKRAVDGQVRKYALEKQHAGTAIEELSENITSQLHTMQQQVKTSTSALPSAVTETLKSDDRVFTRLERLLSDPFLSEDAEADFEGKSEKLSRKLAEYNAELIRTRLDRIYLQAEMAASASSNGTSEADKQDLEALRGEIESLYSEIDPVAEMSVQDQFHKPILREIEQKNASRISNHATRLEYISSTLDYLTRKLNIIKEHTQLHGAHREGIELLSVAVNREISDQLAQQAPLSPSKPRPPIRRRSSATAPKSPVREKRPTHRRKASGTFVEEEENPAQQLFKLLSINLRPDCSRQEAETTLAAAVAERSAKLQTHFASLESSTRSSLTTYLGDADKTLQLLMDTLYVDTPFSEVKLLDEDTETRVKRQEKIVSEVGAGMAALDMEILRTRDKKREEFVERWAE